MAEYDNTFADGSPCYRGAIEIDLSKLTPAPWHVDRPRINPRIKSGDNFVMESHAMGGVRAIVDAEFIALARNAFDGDPEALGWWEANRRKREE